MPRSFNGATAGVTDYSGRCVPGRSQAAGRSQAGEASEVFASLLFAPARTPTAPHGAPARTPAANKASAQPTVDKSLAHLSINPGPSGLHTAAASPAVLQSSLFAPTASYADRAHPKHTSHRATEHLEPPSLV
jgi:hypothetical protein